jgi:SAM-dependent methyltransferase
MMPVTWFTNIINRDSLDFVNGRWISRCIDKSPSSWSFSEEWKEHAATRQKKTWDMTAEERLRHFYSETRTAPGQLPGKLVLDAGCGNGQLTKAIASAGANVAGIDRQPYLPPGNDNTQFVQCDFDQPPFLAQSFDIIIANGSIHHTRDTFQSFQSLASLVKGKGKLYVWVYKNQSGGKKFLLWCLDLSRFFISRFPPRLQRIAVNLLTNFFFALSRIRKGENSYRSKDELRINVYDAFTPKYRHYHTVEEVSDWFSRCGFEDMAITHDNNKYGFGMLGIRKSQSGSRQSISLQHEV